jgi:hypothetical protein
MSVEKISPLARTSVEASAPRIGGASVAAPAAASVPPSAAPPALESPSHLFDSLALPLAALAAEASQSADSTFVRASYARETSRPNIAALVAGGLPEEVIRREVQALLQIAADRRDVTVARLISKTPAAAEDRLPSRNAPRAEFSLETRVLARDEAGEPRQFDLFLTRAGPRQWEVAVFRHDATRERPDFPYPAPPIDVYRMVIDPGAGMILACVAQNIAPRQFDVRSTSQVQALEGALRMGAFVVAGVAIALLLAKYVSTALAFGALVATIAHLLLGPKEGKPRPQKRGAAPIAPPRAKDSG